jgi:hypothetical protein
MNFDALYGWLIDSTCFFLLAWTVALAVATVLVFRQSAPALGSQVAGKQWRAPRPASKSLPPRAA